MFGDIGAMIGNYNSRKVGNYEEGDLYISTARVTDSRYPYETAVSHPKYNNNKLIIVENYDTKAEAEAGHARWIATMTGDSMPTTLKDVSAAGVAKLCDIFGDDWRDFDYEDDDE